MSLWGRVQKLSLVHDSLEARYKCSLVNCMRYSAVWDGPWIDTRSLNSLSWYRLSTGFTENRTVKLISTQSGPVQLFWYPLAPTCILLCNVIHKSMCFYISFQMKGDDWGHPNCWIKNWEVLQMFCTLWLGRWLGLIGDDYQVFSTFPLIFVLCVCPPL